MGDYIWLLVIIIICAGGPVQYLKILAISAIPCFLLYWLIIWVMCETEWGIRFQLSADRPTFGKDAQKMYDKLVIEPRIRALREKKKRKASPQNNPQSPLPPAKNSSVENSGGT